MDEKPLSPDKLYDIQYSMLKTLNVMLDVLKSLDKRMATIEEIINGPQ